MSATPCKCIPPSNIGTQKYTHSPPPGTLPGHPSSRGEERDTSSCFLDREVATPTHSGLFAKPAAVQSTYGAFFWFSVQVLPSRLCALGQVTFPLSLLFML